MRPHPEPPPPPPPLACHVHQRSSRARAAETGTSLFAACFGFGDAVLAMPLLALLFHVEVCDLNLRCDDDPRCLLFTALDRFRRRAEGRARGGGGGGGGPRANKIAEENTPYVS